MCGTYIMFCWSQSFGGGQNYVNSKVEYLKKNGWDTLVFTPREKKSNEIVWGNLKEYDRLISIYLLYPPEFWPSCVRKKVVNWMSSFIKEKSEIIIESPTDTTAEWGELLAQKLDAKHWCFLLDERIEEYRAKDFLTWKFKRNEVAAIHNNCITRLFGIDTQQKNVLVAANNGSVQDVKTNIFDNMPSSDFRIAYLGRDKAYIPNIIKGIADFAAKYSDKTVNLIVIGDITSGSNTVLPDNVSVDKYNFMNPIPRLLFAKLDCVIAGAGCANLSAREGVLTIVPDAKTFDSNGILWIETESSLFSDMYHKSFVESLEDVLIYKKYKTEDIKIPPNKDSYKCYENHFEFINNTCNDKIYFDFKLYPQKLDIMSRLRFIKEYITFYI